MSHAAGASRSWTEWASDRLAAAGRKRGGARRELLELMAGQSCALSAFEIEDRLAAGPRRVSRASIYRILEELEAVGIAQRVEVGNGITRFEPVRLDHDHHHHLVCDSCGSLQPFTDAGLERAGEQAAARVDHDVSEHEIVLHGTCRGCAG